MKSDERKETQQDRASIGLVPWPTGERQEHLDVVVAFVGVGQRTRNFRVLDILAAMWATGDFPEECRFFLNTQLMFWKKDKYHNKEFDDDERIRSLTEAEAINADVPEGRKTYAAEETTTGGMDVYPKKVRPVQMGECMRKYVSCRLLAHSTHDGDEAGRSGLARRSSSFGNLTPTHL